MSHIYFPDYGDSVTGECRIIIGVHQTVSTQTEALELITPPKLKPDPLASFMWKPFNKRDYAVSYAHGDDSFDSAENSLMQQTEASHPKAGDGEDVVKYFLHEKGGDTRIQPGSSVLSWNSPCPQYDANPNDNLFGPILVWNL